MSLFTRLGDLLKPPQPYQTKEAFTLPYGLSNEDWSKLKVLTSEDGWEVFLHTLDALAKLDGERMLTTSDDKVLHFLRGHVVGLRKAATLIEEITHTEHRFVTEHRRAPEPRARVRDGRAALYGSPGWRPQSTDGGRAA